MARCRSTCGCRSSRASRTRSRWSSRSSTSTGISDLFPEGGDVTVDDLVAKGAVRDGHPVKVLGQGDLSVAVQVSANAFSASAKEKIEAAGGTTTVV